MKNNLIRKKICLFLALVLFLSVAGFCQTEGLKIRVKVRRANVRAEPRMKAEIIAVVKRGRILQVDGREGEWYLIRLPLKLEGYALPGYIHQSVVEVVGAEPSAPELKGKRRKPVGGPQKYGASLVLGSAFPSEREYTAGLDFSGSFSYRVSDRFTLELTLRAFSSGVVESAQELSIGTLSVFPVQLSIQRRIPLREQAVAYITGGIGYNFISFSLEDTSFNREETVKNTLGYHVGGGIEYLYKGNLAFRADLKYIFVSTSGSWSFTDPVTGFQSGSIDSVKLNSLLIGVGITYFF